MKKTILLLFSICLLTGCNGKGIENNTNSIENSIEPNLTILGTQYSNDRYSYVIDNNTGVVYLKFDAPYRHSITVMLNADGTPVTAEQLGIEY